MGFRISCFSSQCSGSGIRDPGFGRLMVLRVPFPGFRFWGFGSQFSGFGIRETHRGDEAVEGVEVDGIVDPVDPV